MKSSNIGGQAVMEGIMMRHKDKYSIAVRKPDGEIVISNASAQAIRKAQAAFSGVAEEIGVYNEEDVQALVDEVRYGKGK